MPGKAFWRGIKLPADPTLAALVAVAAALTLACFSFRHTIAWAGRNLAGIFELTRSYGRLEERVLAARGIKLMRSGRIEEGELLLTRSLEVDPNQEFLRERAVARMLLGRLSEASEDCRRYLALDPNDGRARLALYEIERRRGASRKELIRIVEEGISRADADLAEKGELAAPGPPPSIAKHSSWINRVTRERERLKQVRTVLKRLSQRPPEIRL